MVVFNENELDSIAFELKNNKAVVCLTDTIFGILSIDKKLIYKIKKRPFYKKVILLIPSITYVKKASQFECDFLKKIWPSPLTIVKAKKSYRIPNDDFIFQLVAKVGPLYCSSANISKRETIKSIEDAYLLFKKFESKIVYVIREKKYGEELPSTIFDIDKKSIIREGSISLDLIMKSFDK